MQIPFFNKEYRVLPPFMVDKCASFPISAQLPNELFYFKHSIDTFHQQLSQKPQMLAAQLELQQNLDKCEPEYAALIDIENAHVQLKNKFVLDGDLQLLNAIGLFDFLQGKRNTSAVKISKLREFSLPNAVIGLYQLSQVLVQTNSVNMQCLKELRKAQYLDLHQIFIVQTGEMSFALDLMANLFGSVFSCPYLKQNCKTNELFVKQNQYLIDGQEYIQVGADENVSDKLIVGIERIVDVLNNK
ncbi:Hypothetical_protein [Hexamita inflata]|uniref:Hypothetical_protein n=1 Tax=Hexamita inflata TaxID=28002 RepID=A0AA86P6T3_9EUKA|nr:Hypothetical protein HINF_LOCUS20496 [Hexamita inflata]